MGVPRSFTIEKRSNCSMLRMAGGPDCKSFSTVRYSRPGTLTRTLTIWRLRLNLGLETPRTRMCEYMSDCGNSLVPTIEAENLWRPDLTYNSARPSEETTEETIPLASTHLLSP